MVKKVVILGGGTGGTFLANLLAAKRRKEIKNGDEEVRLIGEGFRHYFQPANLDVAFRGVPPDTNSRSELELLDRAVSFVPDPATKIDLADRAVETEGNTAYGYDILVVATGATPAMELVPGLKEGSVNFHASPRAAESVWDQVKGFKGGNIVVAIAGVPYKSPPSPNEALFLLDDHFRRRGMRERIEMTLVTPYPRSYPEEEIDHVVRPRMEEKRIGLIPDFDMDSVDPAKKKVRSLSGDEVGYDLLVAVPPHRGARVVFESDIGNKEGWIPTNRESLRIKGCDDAYAIGDATDIPISKSGEVAHLEARVAADTLSSTLAGEASESRYDGRTNCPMEVGSHRAIFITGTYQSPPKPQAPSFLKYAMMRGFARLYWSTLSGGWEWLVDRYFGETGHVPLLQT